MKPYKKSLRENDKGINLRKLTFDVKNILDEYGKKNNMSSFKSLTKSISARGFNVFNDKFNLVEIEYFGKGMIEEEKSELLKLAQKVLSKHFKNLKFNKDLNRIQISF